MAQICTLTGDAILFEDADVIAINKPPGFPTQGTVDPNRDHVLAALTRFLSARDGRKPYLALHHRLDRDTTGVLILAKSQRANKGLADAFRDRCADKVYVALTSSGFPAQVTVDNHLKKESRTSSRMIVTSSGGDRAITEFLLLSECKIGSYIQCHPLTGRMHQIRVHAATLGFPLIGDRLYGAEPSTVRRVILHAKQLKIPHPVTQKPLALEAKLPQDFQDLVS